METHPSEPLKVVDKTGRRSWLGFPPGALLHWGSRPRYPLLDWCLLNSPHEPRGRSWQPLSHLLMPRASPRATHNQQRGKENKYRLRNTALSAQVTAWKKRYYAEAPTLQWCASPIMVGEKLLFFSCLFFSFCFQNVPLSLVSKGTWWCIVRLTNILKIWFLKPYNRGWEISYLKGKTGLIAVCYEKSESRQ